MVERSNMPVRTFARTGVDIVQTLAGDADDMGSQDDTRRQDVVDRNIDIGFDFTERILADPSLMPNLSNDSLIVLLPDDDPELANANLKGPVRAARTGRNVSLFTSPVLPGCR